jgi:hypothetical protein
VKSAPFCLALLLLARNLSAETPPADTAFLDQPFPADFPWDIVADHDPTQKGPVTKTAGVNLTSFAGFIDRLQRLTGKKMILSDDLADWMQRHGPESWGNSWRGPGDAKTVRPFFEALCREMNLAWRYDAGRDGICLQPRWKRDDTRTAAQLVQVLLRADPSSCRLRSIPGKPKSRSAGAPISMPCSASLKTIPPPPNFAFIIPSRAAQER